MAVGIRDSSWESDMRISSLLSKPTYSNTYFWYPSSPSELVSWWWSRSKVQCRMYAMMDHVQNGKTRTDHIT